MIEDRDLFFNNYPVQAHQELRQLHIPDFEKQNDEYLLSGLFGTNAIKRYPPLTGKITLKEKAVFL